MSDQEHQHPHERCHELLSTLGEYVEGSLSSDLCLELERHLKTCHRCRVVVDTLKKTVDLYHETAEDTPMPADVRQRLYLRLKLDDYRK